jgi:hypothetical protein
MQATVGPAWFETAQGRLLRGESKFAALEQQD